MAQQQAPKGSVEDEQGFKERVGYEQTIYRQIDRVNDLHRSMLHNPALRLFLDAGNAYEQSYRSEVQQLGLLIPESWKEDAYKQDEEDLQTEYDDWTKKRQAQAQFKDRHWYWQKKFQNIINLLDRRGLLLSRDRMDEID